MDKNSNKSIGIVEIERQRVRPLNQIGRVEMDLAAGSITKKEAAERIREILRNA